MAIFNRINLCVEFKMRTKYGFTDQLKLEQPMDEEGKR